MARALGSDLAFVQARHLGWQRADLPVERRRLSRAQGPGRRQIADVSGAHPPDLRDPGQLAAGCGADACADGGVGLHRSLVQPGDRHETGEPRDMSTAFENRLIDTLLWGSLTLVLIFFYIPIFTLIAFS